jgi:DNA-directed RNA polymerase beta subunit
MTAIAIDYPVLTKDSQTIITPRECRERKITYSAPMSVSFKCGINGIDDRETITRAAGCLPIMVLSNRCHLSGLDEAGLSAAREVCGLRQGKFLLCIAD